MSTFDFGPDCDAIAHVKRQSDGLELQEVEVRRPNSDEPTIIRGEEFGRHFDKQSDIIEAIAARMDGARVSIADVISETDPIVIPFTNK